MSQHLGALLCTCKKLTDFSKKYFVDAYWFLTKIMVKIHLLGVWKVVARRFSSEQKRKKRTLKVKNEERTFIFFKDVSSMDQTMTSSVVGK
jgi:hypothetical protein